MKKYLFEISVGAIVIVGLVFFTINNIFIPCKKGKVEIFVCENYENERDEFYRDKFDALIDVYNGISTEEIIHEDEKLVRTNPKLPSSKASDYKSIAVEINIKNRSIFDLTNFSATIKNNDPDSRVLYTYGSVVTETVERLEESQVCVMWLEVYIGDLTDEELLEYIRGLDITIYYESAFAGEKSQEISLKNAEYRE